MRMLWVSAAVVLAAASVAKGGAEPGQTMTTIDFDGKPRPNPAKMPADCGAFEAP